MLSFQKNKKNPILLDLRSIYGASGRAAVFPARMQCHTVLALIVIREPPPRRWCNTCQLYYMGDLIQHRRTQGHKVLGPPRWLQRHPLCGLQAQGWGGGSPGWKREVNVSLCPCMAVARDESVTFPLWASVSPSVQCGRGTISPRIQPRGLWGPLASALSVF